MRKVIFTVFIMLSFVVIGLLKGNTLRDSILDEGFEDTNFPPSGWIMFGWEDGIGGSDVWQRSTYQPHSGNASARSIYKTFTETNYWLVSPKLGLTGYAEVNLSFWHKPRHNNDSNYLKITTLTDSTDTTSYEILDEFHTASDDWQYYEVSLDDYIGCSVFVAWQACESSDWEYWYLDDVMVSALTPLNHDVKCQDVKHPPLYVVRGCNYSPCVSVKNIGLNTETFGVHCRIDTSGGTIYNDDVTVTNLAPFDEEDVLFNPFQPVGDSCIITFYTELTGDEQRENDTLRFIVYVVNRLSTDTLYAPWPSFLHNMQNSGRTNICGPSEDDLSSVTSYSTGSGIHSSPAIGPGGWVCFGSDDGYLYILEEDLSLKGSYETPGEVIRTSPAIDSNGNIYFGSNDDYFYSVDSMGNYRWSFYMGAGANPSAPPVIGSNNAIYVGCGAIDSFIAFNPGGSVKWTITTSGGVYGVGAALRGDIIYFGTTNDHRLYAVEDLGATYDIKWIKWLDRGLSATPTVKGDTIFYALNDGKLYAVRDTGSSYEDLWSVSIDPPKAGLSEYRSSPVIGFDHTIYVGTPYNHLVAVYPNGEIKWKFGTQEVVYSSPVIDSAGVIYFGSNDDTLYAIIDSVVYAIEKWKSGTGGNIRSSISMSNFFYFTSQDGSIYRLGPLTGIDEEEKDQYISALYPNQPNPFSQTTTISYTCREFGQVSIRVYDLSGRLVKTLVNELQTPGYYTAKFDATRLPQGIYFIRLKTAGSSAVQKAIHIK